MIKNWWTRTFTPCKYQKLVFCLFVFFLFCVIAPSFFFYLCHHTKLLIPDKTQETAWKLDQKCEFCIFDLTLSQPVVSFGLNINFFFCWCCCFCCFFLVYSILNPANVKKKIDEQGHLRLVNMLVSWKSLFAFWLKIHNFAHFQHLNQIDQGV